MIFKCLGNCRAQEDAGIIKRELINERKEGREGERERGRKGGRKGRREEGKGRGRVVRERRKQRR